MPAEDFARKDFDAKNYAAVRPRYPDVLFKKIMEFHDRDGKGGRDFAVDLGCGPGLFTRMLLGSDGFKRVLGVDPSEPMLEAAKVEVPQAEFKVGGAGSMPFLESGSVDLITCATCMHYFPPNWYAEAERVLKPSGTIAAFTYGALTMIGSEPMSEKFDQINADFRKELSFDPTALRVITTHYDDFTGPPEGVGIKLAERANWNRDGKGEFAMKMEYNLKQLRQLMLSASPLHKWRTENPSLCGGPDDPLDRAIARVKEVVGVRMMMS